jgi:hypothetical protein
MDMTMTSMNASQVVENSLGENSFVQPPPSMGGLDSTVQEVEYGRSNSGMEMLPTLSPQADLTAPALLPPLQSIPRPPGGESVSHHAWRHRTLSGAQVWRILPGGVCVYRHPFL